MGKCVQVYREDGNSYPSGMAAARAIAREQGLSIDSRYMASMSGEIIRAARLSGKRTAYGYRWSLEDVFLGPAIKGYQKRIRRLETALGIVRARLENANDRLREAGLEQA